MSGHITTEGPMPMAEIDTSQSDSRDATTVHGTRPRQPGSRRSRRYQREETEEGLAARADAVSPSQPALSESAAGSNPIGFVSLQDILGLQRYHAIAVLAAVVASDGFASVGRHGILEAELAAAHAEHICRVEADCQRRVDAESEVALQYKRREEDVCAELEHSLAAHHTSDSQLEADCQRQVEDEYMVAFQYKQRVDDVYDELEHSLAAHRATCSLHEATLRSESDELERTRTAYLSCRAALHEVQSSADAMHLRMQELTISCQFTHDEYESESTACQDLRDEFNEVDQFKSEAKALRLELADATKRYAMAEGKAAKVDSAVAGVHALSELHGIRFRQLEESESEVEHLTQIIAQMRGLS